MERTHRKRILDTSLPIATPPRSSIIDLQKLGVSKTPAAVNIAMVQYVIAHGLHLKFCFLDGTESAYGVKEEGSLGKLFPLLVDAERMITMPFQRRIVALDLNAVAEIKYFPHGDPEDVDSDGISGTRIWFAHGELFLAGASVAEANVLIRHWVKSKVR
jgi:hypothetical protein